MKSGTSPQKRQKRGIFRLAAGKGSWGEPEKGGDRERVFSIDNGSLVRYTFLTNMLTEYP